jgi:acetyl esterase/lipase
LTITSLAYMRDRAAGTVQGPAAQPVAAAAGSPQQQQQQQQQPGRPAFHPPLAAIMISPATDFTNSSVFRRGLPEQAQEQLQQQKQQSSTQGSAASDGGSATGGSSSSRSSRRNSTEELFHYDYVSKGEGNDVIRLYLPPPHDASGLSDPLVSPIFLKNFSGLVRRELLVVTGGCEAMVPDIHRFVARVKDVSPELLVTHHVEEAEPHCYCVLHTGKLLDKGAAVLLPFMMRMCSGSSSTGSIARPA